MAKIGKKTEKTNNFLNESEIKYIFILRIGLENNFKRTELLTNFFIFCESFGPFKT